MLALERERERESDLSLLAPYRRRTTEREIERVHAGYSGLRALQVSWRDILGWSLWGAGFTIQAKHMTNSF